MKTGVLDFVRQHWILTGLVVLAAVLTVWWRYEFPSATWRYKITVEIETPEGVKTGSAVRQIGQFTDIKIGDTGGGAAGTTGEAVVVDLGKRGQLFLLVGEDHNFLFRVFPFSKGGNTPEGIKYYSHLKNAKASILGLENLRPQFVRFKDLSDPKSVEEVDIHNLAEIFGEGVRVKDVTIETTDEPMTRGMVDSYLPWLKSTKSNIDGTEVTFSNELSNSLHVGNFRSGVRK
jgi:hypothetical protein